MSKVETLKQEYIKKFGGYPSFLLQGADEEYIIDELSKALEAGKEIEAPDPDAEY